MATLTEVKTNWTESEFKAYTFIYCMNSDMKETKEEIELIKKMVGDEIYNKMSVEFKNDSDYESIQKISSTAEDLALTKDQIQLLFQAIKEIFDADKKFSIMERNITLGLKRVLNY